jgi:hypothetical protein
VDAWATGRVGLHETPEGGVGGAEQEFTKSQEVLILIRLNSVIP